MPRGSEHLVELEVMLQNAKPVGRRCSSELQDFDVGTADEPFILTDAELKILFCKRGLT